MKLLRYASLLLPLITAMTWGQAAAQGKLLALPKSRPDALVSSLYEQVVARHPIGIPYGANKKIFAPYLSQVLLRRFDSNEACFADWRRQNPDPSLKPPFGMIEDGIFSGGDEKAEPKVFHIERTELGKDGSSRVYVRLVWEDPPNKRLIWYVAAVVIPENDHLAVDDVFFLKNKIGDVESSLSEVLSLQCAGGRWIGNFPHPK
jgi:hypothetical protein